MSDEIIININPSASDNIIVDATTPAPESIQITPILSNVASVNGKTGVVILDKNDIGLDQVDNTNDLNKPISLSALAFVNSKFFPITGGIISGDVRINSNLTVYGNLTATGTTTFANTIFSTTSSLSVVHVGSGPALWVGNSGLGDIASFYDIDQNLEILHIGGNNGTFPNVGVKTSQPNKTFTVVGEISSTSDITNSGKIYTTGGNSDRWNSVYSNVNSNSATYATRSFVNNNFLPLSGGIINGNLYVTNLTAISAIINVLDLRIYELSGFDVKGNAQIDGNVFVTQNIGTLNYNSAQEWNSVYTTFNSLSDSYATKTYTSGYLPLSGGTVSGDTRLNNVSISSLNAGPITGTRISLSDLTFTGYSTYAKSLTGKNLFVEVKIGNITKYLQLFDIDTAFTYYVDFDGPSETKPSYASGNVTLSGIQWNLTEALIGTETNEVIAGSRSARLRGYATTTMTMLSDKADGISNIKFLYRSYISPVGSPDTSQVLWVVDYSTDSGITWLSAGTFTATPTIQTFNSYINVTAPARIRFRTTATGSTNRRANIDNITINPYT